MADTEIIATITQPPAIEVTITPPSSLSPSFDVPTIIPTLTAIGPRGLPGADSTVPGPAGADGTNGADGADGVDGEDGVGVPSGGTTGQSLVKASNTDFDTEWSNAGSGDMTKAVYDPQNIADDAFSQDNMTDGSTNKNYTGTEKTKLAGIASGANVGVVPNGAITGATKTKITYDAKGLVTSGADATTADIADSSNKRYVSDAQLVVIGNTSGANTGDQNLSGYFNKSTDDLDDITDGTTNKAFTSTEKTKLSGIETAADVTDAANVDAAGATMNADTTLAGNGYFLDEDNMASDSATKVPSQQSVKAYVVASVAGKVDTANSPNANEFARFTDADTIEGRTASELKSDLDLEIGTDLQAYDADLTTIAGLTATTDNFIVSVASAWASRTPAQVRTTLGLVIGTNVQAWDADLDTIAGLTATTDNFMVAVSSAWASRTPSQVRTTLGLVIGTNVQAYDAELAAIAGLTSAADKGIQFTGSGTASTFDLTTAGKNLLDDANAAAQIATLGLDADIATLSIPASTTISTYAKSYLDDADEATFKATVNLEANTDFYAPGGTDVPVTDGGTGASSAATAIANLGGLPTAGGTMTGSMTLAENAGVALDPAGSADGKWTGITIAATAGYTQAFGDLVYLDPTDSRWEATDANSAGAADGDARGILGMVVSAGTDGTACTILLHGVIRADAKFPSFTINNPIYVSETAGLVTQTQPTTTDVVIRIIGSALTADELYFNPDRTWITHT